MIATQKDGLARVLAQGRAIWPTIQLEENALASFLTVGRVQDDALGQNPSDIYLAAACAAGIPQALACFDSKFLSRVDRYVNRMRLAPDAIDEIRQQLRIRMIGPDGKIGQYSGLAPLDRWLRLACVRLALDLISVENRRSDHPGSDEILQGMAGMDNPELNAIRSKYAASIEEEVRRAMERLSDRDKTLLRLYFVEGLNVDQIGSIYRVHRATVARWIKAIRAGILEEVRRHLKIKTGATASEFRSLVRLLDSELALSLTRLLAPRSPEGGLTLGGHP